MPPTRRDPYFFPALPGVFPAAQAARFPHLARQLTFSGRWLLRGAMLFPVTMLLLFLTDALLTRATGAAPSKFALYLIAAGQASLALCFGVPALITGFKGAESRAELKRKGWSDFGPTLPVYYAGSFFSAKLMRRVPPISEIESTPYNNPNDPEALLRMLDDLAAQMDGAEGSSAHGASGG